MKAEIRTNREEIKTNEERMEAKTRMKRSLRPFEVLSSPGRISTKPGQSPLKKK
jgi:hypothetical protein